MKKVRVIESVEMKNMEIEKYLDSEITEVYLKENFVLGSAILCSLTSSLSGFSQYINIYTNQTIYIDMKHCELKECEYQGRKYLILIDHLHYGKTFVIGYSFGELYDLLCKPFHGYRGVKKVKEQRELVNEFFCLN